MIKKSILLGLCLLGLAAPMALAQTPSQTGYGETSVVPDPPSTGNTDPSTSEGSAGPSTQEVSTSDPGAESGADSLPFTGLSLGIVVLMAVVLLGLGVGLRRATAARSAS